MMAFQLESLKDHVNTFQKQDEQRINYDEELGRALQDACMQRDDLEGDLESERTSRQQFQHRIRELESSFTTLQRRIDKASYVLVLIDGDHDGYVFNNDFLMRGLEGGKAAAQEIQKSIKPKLDNGAIDEDVPVMVRVFAHIEGLSKTLERGGIRDASDIMLRFTQGFNQVKFCEFVFVGGGKDRADEKIKALFSHAYADPTCLHIVFGGCHDNGYVRVLELVDDPQARERVTLLKSFQIGHEFSTLSFKRVDFDSLFRTEHIGSLTQPSTGVGPSSTSQSLLPAGKTGPSATSLRTVRTLSSGMLSPVLKNNELSPDSVLLNSSGFRRDRELPAPNQQARFTYKQKLHSGHRYCVDHFLSGQCQRNKCIYEHKGLSEEEVLVFRLDMRELPCKLGISCRNPVCFYGHQCPRDNCTGESCKFEFSLGMHKVSGD